MNKTVKRIAAFAAAAGLLPICGCTALADYSENAGEIKLDTMKVTGNGISVADNVITITKGGDFSVTGEADDAMIYVNADDKVKLRLSGMSIKNADGPAIFFDNAEKALVTITENTENHIEDGAQYGADYADTAKAALFSNDDLEIKGNGALTVVGNYKHAIASDDDIKIENGTINITANAKDGVHANNDIEISGGNITVASETQGFQAEENFIQSGGNITVTKCTEGVESGASITISGGETDITASDDGLNSGGGSSAGSGTGTGGNDFGGQRQQMPMDDNFDPNSTPPPLPEGMDGQMAPNDGQFGGRSGHMHGENGWMTTDGQMPDGDFNGQRPQIPGGNFDPNSTPPPLPEGMDGQMAPNDGQFGGRGGHMNGGGMQPIDDGVDRNLYISGGVIRINAGGDGVDSNADIIMTGGELYVDGPTNAGNGAIDCFSFDVSGGTVIAVGAAGMAMGVSQDSNQCGILVNTQTIKAGTAVELKDGDNVIMSYTPKKDISSIVYSSDKLQEGAEYTLYAGGGSVETVSMTAKQVTVGERGMGGFGGHGMGRFGEAGAAGGNTDRIRVILNGEELQLDADPIIADDTTLIPLRNVLEALGLTVDWDEETSTVTAQKDGITLSLTIGSTDAKVNGESKKLLTAPRISNDRTIVPIRFIAEALGCAVGWDGNTRTVTITD